MGSEGQKGKTKYQVVDEDVTSKSSFEVLEATLPNSTCEHGTFQAQGEGVATVEHDMLTIQECHADPMVDIQNKQMEAPPKKVL